LRAKILSCSMRVWKITRRGKSYCRPHVTIFCKKCMQTIQKDKAHSLGWTNKVTRMLRWTLEENKNVIRENSSDTAQTRPSIP
jgi:hypothetical protein